MRRLAGTANRLLLAVVGLLLILVGGAVIALGAGYAAQVFPALSDGRTNIGEVLAFLHQPMGTGILLAVALILTIVGVFWLISQVPRKDAAKPLRMQLDARRGVTTVPASIIASAVSSDLEVAPGVIDSEVILRGSAKSPDLFIHIDVDERADVDEAIEDVVSRVAGNAVVALGLNLSSLAIEVGAARRSGAKQRSVTLA